MDDRGPGGSGHRQPPSVDLAVRAVPLRRRGRADRGGQRGLWHDVCAGFGLDPDTEGIATNPERAADRQRVITLVEEVFSRWNAAELLDRLSAVGIPAGKVRTIDEVYDWDQTRSQGLLIDVEHSTLGALTLPGPPLRFFDGGGAEQTHRDHHAPPTLDEHGDTIRAWLEEDA